MPTDLLERDREIATLEVLLRATAAGHGHVAVISGEAGIGKTSLVERCLAQVEIQPSPRPLWAACESLFTPRPLGPLYDVAQQMQGPLGALLEGDAKRATLFAATLNELSRTSTVLVIEDIHWADEATLDLIKYLARRIQQTATLLILTYRDDELGKDHPLRLVMGDLPTQVVTWVRLLPLSEEAVAKLAQQARRPAGRLHAITGGNPFFLTETLAYDAPGAPASVSAAVLARIARRSPAAQRLLELVAVAPNRIERWLLEEQGVGDETALDECLAAHMLRLDGQTIAFRHELARQAVEGGLLPARRQALNAKILHALLRHGAERTSLARLAHHATAAEDPALVLRFVPEAARQAAAQGAHREAAAHCQMALRYADQIDQQQRADLLSALANELYLIGQVSEAVQPCDSALTLWRALGNAEKIGQTLRRLSRLSWLLGRNAEAEQHGLAAVAALEPLPPGRELAMAYGNLAHLGTRMSDGNTTLLWGERAISLAERLGDHETMCYALNSVAAAEITRGNEQGVSKLERSLVIALEHGYEEHVARAYANLGLYRVLRHEYPLAEGRLREGIAYCAERDLDPWGHFLRWVRARAHLDHGKWAQAEEEAADLVSIPWIAITNRIPALLVLAQVRARRGEPGVDTLLDSARELALSIGEPHRMEQVAAARAEWRWLQVDQAGCADEARAAFHPETLDGTQVYSSQVAIWLWRSGALEQPLSGMLAPHALEMGGDWKGAADAWEQAGCPFEQALALVNGNEAAQRAALAIFERLGAAPAVEIARRQLHERRTRGLPRSPHPMTRANPLGLTNRELDVLPLLAEGLRNAEIAERLSTSRKTIEHHVSAILAKLDARSRAEAVGRAYEAGLLSHTMPPTEK